MCHYYVVQGSSKINMKRGSTAGNRSFLLGSDECLRKRALWTRRDWSAPRPCLVPVPFSLSASPHISREKQTAISLGSSVCSTQFQVILFIMPCKVETPVIQKKVDSLNCSFNFVLEIQYFDKVLSEVCNFWYC